MWISSLTGRNWRSRCCTCHRRSLSAWSQVATTKKRRRCPFLTECNNRVQHTKVSKIDVTDPYFMWIPNISNIKSWHPLETQTSFWIYLTKTRVILSGIKILKVKYRSNLSTSTLKSWNLQRYPRVSNFLTMILSCREEDYCVWFRRNLG